MSMIRYHKVEIKRKDLYSKDYSRIKYSNNIDEDRKVSHIKKRYSRCISKDDGRF